MSKFIKKVVPIFLTISILCGLMPFFGSAAFGGDELKEISGSYDLIPENDMLNISNEISESSELVLENDIWNQIDSLEDEKIIPTKSSTVTVEDYAELSYEVEALVKASKTYVESSIVRNGDFFTWETTEGIVCGYSPELRYETRNTVEQSTGVTETISYATKSDDPNTKNVYLIAPYYGLDPLFTGESKSWAGNAAKAIGGTYTLYQGANATITNIATAMENGEIVIFDSHGLTDYKNGNDKVSRANTSYLCLTNGAGITAEDMIPVSGTYGTYYHALYAGKDSYRNDCYLVDGTAITNHMTKTAPNSILWMGMCLGMATDGLCKPLRDAGVEVVFGYSQSVQSYGSYKHARHFWNEMNDGADVKTAAAYMKSASKCNWDPYYASYTLAQAQSKHVAFPIFVSDEDPYPGQGAVDAVQTVKSTYAIKSSQIRFHLYGDRPDNNIYSIMQGQSCNIRGYIDSGRYLKRLEFRFDGSVYKIITDFTTITDPFANPHNHVSFDNLNGLIPFEGPELSIGTHTLTITATDENNVSASTTLTIKVNGIPIYRLYNSKSKEHLFTASKAEKDTLLKAGWNDEGIAFHAQVTYGTPVYRMYHAKKNCHHYTTSKQERNTLMNAGWTYEGIAFNSVPASNYPVYRFFNSKLNQHHFTSSTAERDSLLRSGWAYEGIAFYDAPPVS